MLKKNERHHDHVREFDLTDVIQQRSFHELRNGLPLDLPELDLLISFTARPPAIKNPPKFGVLSIANSDDRLFPESPLGFWEVYFHHDVTCFSIRHSTGRGDDEIVLSGYTTTQFYFLLNQASWMEKATYYLAKMVSDLAINGVLPKAKPALPVSALRRGLPTPYQSVLYLLDVARRGSLKIIDKIRGFEFRWHVGFVRSDWRHTAFRQAAIIPNPPDRYLADPFVLSREGKDYCFVEDYNEASKRARIAVYELHHHGATNLGIALAEDFHLSYPYLFNYRGELYMCPETSANREIRVYKCIDFPLNWRLEKIIMENVSAVDTILFERDGRWWLLTNLDPAGWNDFALEFCVFSAASPLDDEWMPHPMNPMFIDASRTRNGGIVRDGDRVFRVAQGQGFGMYGKRTLVQEIVELDNEKYVERTVCVNSGAFGKGVYGTHHLNDNGSITVFDFACRSGRQLKGQPFL